MVEALLLALEHPNAVGESFNVGNARSAVTIYDLALRIKRLTASNRPRVPAAPLHRRRAARAERRQGPRAPRLRGEGRARRRARANDRVVPGAPGRMTEPIRLARPDVGEEELAAAPRSSARASSRWGRRSTSSRPQSRRRWAPLRPPSCRPEPRLSISRCSRSRSGRGRGHRPGVRSRDRERRRTVRGRVRSRRRRSGHVHRRRCSRRGHAGGREP